MYFIEILKWWNVIIGIHIQVCWHTQDLFPLNLLSVIKYLGNVTWYTITKSVTGHRIKHNILTKETFKILSAQQYFECIVALVEKTANPGISIIIFVARASAVHRIAVRHFRPLTSELYVFLIVSLRHPMRTLIQLCRYRKFSFHLVEDSGIHTCQPNVSLVFSTLHFKEPYLTKSITPGISNGNAFCIN